MRAFPGLNREDFENDTYVFWDLKKFNFDGTAPIDYALFLRQSASSGPYEWVLAIRGNNKVVYQRMLGYYRGLYNIMRRAKEKSQPNQRQNPREGINKFLELANISQNPSNIDGDGKDDLLMHTHFENCDSQNDPYWGLMSNLTYMPVPYFWNGKYMSCRDKKRFQYYGKFEKLLHFLSDEDRIGISSELKKLKGESR